MLLISQKSARSARTHLRPCLPRHVSGGLDKFCAWLLLDILRFLLSRALIAVCILLAKPEVPEGVDAKQAFAVAVRGFASAEAQRHSVCSGGNRARPSQNVMCRPAPKCSKSKVCKALTCKYLVGETELVCVFCVVQGYICAGESGVWNLVECNVCGVQMGT